MLTRTQVTLAEFEAFVRLPENRERLFEYINGEIREVVSNGYSSKLGLRVGRYLGAFVDDNDLGHVTGADGGYWVYNERYIPDAAYVSYAKQAELEYREGYIPVAPDLAVEVLSPGNEESEMLVKVANYLNAGTLLWLVYPLEKQVQVFAPGAQVRTLTLAAGDVLDGGSVLADFTLPLAQIFK